jgi:hypothetical protein
LLGAPAAVTNPHVHNVAPADPDALVPFGRAQIVRRYVVARLQPAHATGARHVEEHPAADDAVGCSADR